jgi:hypothetical protein
MTPRPFVVVDREVFRHILGQLEKFADMIEAMNAAGVPIDPRAYADAKAAVTVARKIEQGKV